MSLSVHEIIHPLIFNTPVSCLHSCYYGIGDYHNRLFASYGPGAVLFLKGLNDPFVVEELSKVHQVTSVRVFSHFLDIYDIKYKFKGEDDNYILSRWRSNFTALEVIPHLPRHLIATVFDEEILECSWSHVSKICKTVCDDMNLVKHYIDLWHPVIVYDTCSGIPINNGECIRGVIHQKRIKEGYCDPVTDWDDIDVAIYYGRWELIKEEDMKKDYYVITDLHSDLMMRYNPETVPEYIRNEITVKDINIVSLLLSRRYLSMRMVNYIEERDMWDRETIEVVLRDLGDSVKSIEAFKYLRSRGVTLPGNSPSTFVLDVESGNDRRDIDRCIPRETKYRDNFLLRLHRSGFDIYEGVRNMFKYPTSPGTSIDNTEMLMFWIKTFPQLKKYLPRVLSALQVGTRIHTWVSQRM